MSSPSSFEAPPHRAKDDNWLSNTMTIYDKVNIWLYEDNMKSKIIPYLKYYWMYHKYIVNNKGRI